MRFLLLESALVVLAGIGLFGCAKGSALSAESPTANATQQPGTTKALFSQWVDSQGFVQIDLRQCQFGSQRPITAQSVTGISCNCQALFQGSESSGTVQISSCTGNNAQCATFNSNGNYQKSTSALTICYTASNCQSFQ
jgi:hypothetical protein